MYPQTIPSAYDRAATMFSPDGRLYQVEYASKIVSQGTAAAAMIYDKGVIFGADKKILSRLVIVDSIEKMFVIDDHIAAVSAGLVGDARRLITMARSKAQENHMYYDTPIGVETLVKEVANIMQIFTQYGGTRPFGVSLIIGGIDESGKRLFETEPSGAIAEYKATAIGRNREKITSLFEKEYKDDLNYDEAITLLLQGLKKSLDEKEKFDYRRLDFAVIEENQKFRRIAPEKLKPYVEKLSK